MATTTPAIHMYVRVEAMAYRPTILGSWKSLAGNVLDRDCQSSNDGTAQASSLRAGERPGGGGNPMKTEPRSWQRGTESRGCSRPAGRAASAQWTRDSGPARGV